MSDDLDPKLQEALERANARIASESIRYPGDGTIDSIQAGRPNITVPTVRELDVLRSLSHGMTIEMAAESMGISRETAHTQLAIVRRKLRAKNKTHAVAIVIREGLID